MPKDKMATTSSTPDVTELILIGQFRKCESIKKSGRHGFRRRTLHGQAHLESGDIREHKSDAKIGSDRRL